MKVNSHPRRPSWFDTASLGLLCVTVHHKIYRYWQQSVKRHHIKCSQDKMAVNQENDLPVRIWQTASRGQWEMQPRLWHPQISVALFSTKNVHVYFWYVFKASSEMYWTWLSINCPGMLSSTNLQVRSQWQPGLDVSHFVKTKMWKFRPLGTSGWRQVTEVLSIAESLYGI